MAEFKIVSDFKPMGDQPKAIENLVYGLNKNSKHQTLLGITGSVTILSLISTTLGVHIGNKFSSSSIGNIATLLSGILLIILGIFEILF